MQTNKNKEKKTVKVDYYSRVIVCQMITAAVLFLVYLLIISPSQQVKDEFLSYLGEKKWDAYEIAASVKEYFSSDGTWQVSGDNVTFAEETTQSHGGTGGEDIDIYSAAENTSFGYFRATVPAVRPIEEGRYTSYFGYRINPITNKLSFHTGIDIAAPEGTNIRAAYSGRVTKVGEDNRAGKYILLTHDDGFQTFYCHCSEILAAEGAVIRQGETIAEVGTTGWSTGPHLHFEIRKNNIRLNPLFILGDDN